jgi:hypothetical protein
MTGSKELGKDSVKQLELSGRPPESIVGLLHRVDGVLNLLDDEGMVADLSELHDGVVETLDDGRSTGPSRSANKKRRQRSGFALKRDGRKGKRITLACRLPRKRGIHAFGRSCRSSAGGRSSCT